MPEVQVFPSPVQSVQAPPPEPQAVKSPRWHPPSVAQQPPAHVVASHTHTPALQRWPVTHSAFVPQPH